MSLSIRNYTANINVNSIQECLNFAAEQAAALNVPISAQTTGELIYQWASWLDDESKSALTLLKAASSMATGAKDVKSGYNNARKLHRILSNRPTLWNKLRGGGKLNPVTEIITSHPFYETFLQEGVENGFDYVSSTYKHFQSIDRKVTSARGELSRVADVLRDLREFNPGDDNLLIPADMTDNLSVAASIEDTRRLLELKPELFWSTTATGALADGAAKEIYLLWKQAGMAVDLAISRWLILAYFGTVLDAAVKSAAAAQVFAATIAGTNAQLKEFSGLIGNISGQKSLHS